MRVTGAVLVGLRILGWSLVFLTVFAGMTLGVAFGLAWVNGSSLTRGHLSVGTICSLIAWLFLAVFHLRRETLHLSFSDRESFVSRLTEVLHGMGYEPTSRSAEQLRFHPSFGAFLLGGGISVKLEPAGSAITGPRVNLESLRGRMRLQQHLDALQSVHESSHLRQHEHLLKRVYLTVRLPQHGSWADVARHLQTVLGAEAELIGDLHILVQSKDGIRETTIDEDVQRWLQERGLVAELHKDHVKRLRSSHHDIDLSSRPEDVTV